MLNHEVVTMILKSAYGYIWFLEILRENVRERKQRESERKEKTKEIKYKFKVNKLLLYVFSNLFYLFSFIV